MAKSRELTFKRTVPAPPALVYRYFTNSSNLREWFSNVATIDPKPGGRAYFAWNNGHYTAGEFKRLDPDKKVVFTWHGRGEPEATTVKVSLAAKKSGTAVTVSHAGVGGGKKWAKHAEKIARGWELALENLESVLATGEDQRYTLRPMVGVTGLEQLTPAIAAEIGTPAKAGLRIDGTVPGMGAEAAGLQKNDVVVRIGSAKVSDYPTLVRALERHRAGDKVAVEYYRGPEKLSVTMTLSKRPLPTVPWTPAELSEAVRAVYAQGDRELAEAVEGITEAEANYRPGPKEWTVREVLAHLIFGARDYSGYLTELIDGNERWYDGFSYNSLLRTQVTAASYPNVPAMLEAYKRYEAEIVALLAGLPADFVERKSTYWGVGHLLLQDNIHMQEHVQQIRAAIAAARQH